MIRALILLTLYLAGCDGPDCETFPREDVSFLQIHAYGLHAAQAYCMRNMLAESNVIVDEAPKSRVQYIVSEDPATNIQWVAIRGTDNATNVLSDANRLMQHSKLLDTDLFDGFAAASREVFERVLPMLDPGKEIRFTGHSLGGAVALILDAMLRRSGEDTGTSWVQGPVITFAQPVVADGSDNRVFCDSELLRVVVSGDPIVSTWIDDPRNLDIFPDQVGSELVMYDTCGEPEWKYFSKADDARGPDWSHVLCPVDLTLDIGARHHFKRYLQLVRRFAQAELPEGESLPEYPELMNCSR